MHAPADKPNKLQVCFMEQGRAMETPEMWACSSQVSRAEMMSPGYVLCITTCSDLEMRGMSPTWLCSLLKPANLTQYRWRRGGGIEVRETKINVTSCEAWVLKRCSVCHLKLWVIWIVVLHSESLGASLYFPEAISAMIGNPLGHELAKTLIVHKLTAYLSFSILVLDALMPMPRLDFSGLMKINHEAKLGGLQNIILINAMWESFIISYLLTSSEVEDERISSYIWICSFVQGV